MQSTLARSVIRILAIGIVALPLAASRGSAPAAQTQSKTKRPLTLENMSGGGRGGPRGVTISPGGRLVAFGTDGPSDAGTSVWSPSKNERKFWVQDSVAAWLPDSQGAIISRESDLWSLAVGSTDVKRITTD